MRSNHGCTGLAKQNEGDTDVRATVWMVVYFTEHIIAAHAAESVLTTSAADSMTYEMIC